MQQHKLSVNNSNYSLVVSFRDDREAVLKSEYMITFFLVLTIYNTSVHFVLPGYLIIVYGKFQCQTVTQFGTVRLANLSYLRESQVVETVHYLFIFFRRTIM